MWPQRLRAQHPGRDLTGQVPAVLQSSWAKILWACRLLRATLVGASTPWATSPWQLGLLLELRSACISLHMPASILRSAAAADYCRKCTGTLQPPAQRTQRTAC